MKTFTPQLKTIKHNWYIVDATDKILGRLATKLAYRLRGKHKTEYTPHIDIGDYIIVLNAKKIKVTGKKYSNKLYYYHTNYVGHIKKITFENLINKHPERLIEIAVKGMLPRGPLGRSMYRKLKVFSDNKHNHIAQQPQLLNI